MLLAEEAVPLLSDEGWLVGAFKLSSRFLQDKVLHDFPRILPEMTPSRFAALQCQAHSAVLRRAQARYWTIEMYNKP